MKTKDIKKMDRDEIVKTIRENQEKLREISFDTTGSRVKNTHEKRTIRREVARLFTALRQLEASSAETK